MVAAVGSQIGFWAALVVTTGKLCGGNNREPALCTQRMKNHSLTLQLIVHSCLTRLLSSFWHHLSLHPYHPHHSHHPHHPHHHLHSPIWHLPLSTTPSSLPGGQRSLAACACSGCGLTCTAQRLRIALQPAGTAVRLLPPPPPPPPPQGEQ